MADFNEYKGVWVFCEQRQGALMPTDFELVSEARKLADELGCEVTGLLLGDNVEGIAKELGGYGADKVMVCDSPLLKDYTTDAYAKVVCDMVNEYKPEVLLIGATNIGRDLGPRCAARLHTGLTADATHLDIDTAKYVEFLKESSTIDLSKQKFDYEDRNLKMTRPAFGGHLMATIICPRFRPQMSTVRPGVMKKAPFDQGRITSMCNLSVQIHAIHTCPVTVATLLHLVTVLVMAMAGEGDVTERLKELNIVPLAISYEYDPCDFLKAKELHRNGMIPISRKVPKTT